MRYLNLFEDYIEKLSKVVKNYQFTKIDKVSYLKKSSKKISFDDDDYETIIDFAIKFGFSVGHSIGGDTLHVTLDENIFFITFDIFKTNDDWYYVKIFIQNPKPIPEPPKQMSYHSLPPVKPVENEFYECDELEGLLNLINTKITSLL